MLIVLKTGDSLRRKMTLRCAYLSLLLLFLTIDLDASASAIRSDSETQSNTAPGGQTPPISGGNNNTDRRLVQKYEPPLLGSNLFEGYSCNTDDDCLNNGHCMSTEFGGALCNCTDAWLGPQCEFSSPTMEYQLFNRPLVRYMFFSCLNSTGFYDNVHALSVYRSCNPGNSACWIRRGGVNAIKVFFWCLNTGYRMLLSEGTARKESRWRLYDGALERLASRFGGDQPMNSNIRSDINSSERDLNSVENPQDLFPGFFPVEGEDGDARSGGAGLDSSSSSQNQIVDPVKKTSRKGIVTFQQTNSETDTDYFGAPDADRSVVVDMP